ncbi:MAG: hypothetical protein AB2A00_11420 [Myxococcota bacterium]
MNRQRLLGVLLCGLLAVTGSHAAPGKKDKPKKADPTAADFLGDFGTTPEKKSQDDLGNAVQGVKSQGAGTNDLAPKAALQDRNASVTMSRVFASAKIAMGSDGCVPPKPGTEVKSLEAPDFPYIVDPFGVCARLESNRGRTLQVTFKIVTPKGRLVGSSEEVVDFTGKSQVDHIVDYPELTFPVPGMYFYRLEVEGVTVAQHELFEIKAKPKAPPAPTVDDMLK